MRSMISRRVAAALLLVATGAALVLIVSTPVARADEGMWLPFKLEDCPVDQWQQRGLALDAKQLYDAKHPSISDAVIQLGGGSASFVSSDGLIVTNHHVAFGALQRTSSVGNDFINDGFLAGTRADEIAAPGYEAKVLVGVKDVTKKVLRKLDDDMGDRERYKAIDTAEKQIVKKAEAGKDVYCQVKSFYGGSQYYLYTYLKIKDIRIVYEPPRSIGVYGGVTDNWMEPRHTVDFSFMRAYVSPDGKSAEYSKENVPYHPRKYLRVSAAPLNGGDFSLVMGYPGRTMRYRTSYSIDFSVNRYYPEAIKMYKEILDIMEEESQRGRMVQIKLASLQRGLGNAYKNNQGMLEGLLKANLLARKREEEAELRRFISSDPKLGKEYGGVLDEINSQYDEYMTYWEQDRLLRLVSYISSPMRSALTLYKWAVEREKPDLERDAGYMDRDESTRKKRLTMDDRGVDGTADRHLFKQFPEKYVSAARPEDAIGPIKAGMSEAQIDELLDHLYANTRLTDKEARMAMFGKSKKELLSSGDAFISFAAKVHERREALRERDEKFQGALQKLRPRLMALRTEASGKFPYPDANSTMRVSVGEIRGYSPRDAVRYDWETTLRGVVQKNTGEEPFDAPQRLIDLYAGRDFGKYAEPQSGEVPVCFLSTNDVTGGNSGSPILNGRGELIGLVFDGNYEAISADYQFIPGLTRTINIDSRYILFALDKFAGAKNVMDKLDVTGFVSPGAGSR